MELIAEIIVELILAGGVDPADHADGEHNRS